MSAINEGAISFDNPNVEAQQRGNFSDKPVLRFHPETNKSYRIKFTSSQVEMRRRHYNPRMGQNEKGSRYFRCLDHLGYCPICVAATREPDPKAKTAIKGASETFGANILIYKTNDQGEIIEPVTADVYFWAFGSDKFVTLRSIQKDWGPLENMDLKVTCTDGQFQKVSITPLPKCLYNEDSALKEACDKKIKEDSYPLDKFLCKELPLLELCKAFKLPINEYVPAEMLAQIPQNQPTAQDVATQPPQYPQQPVQQQAQQTVQQPTQQVQPAAPAPNTVQSVAAQNPAAPIQNPNPPQENFADLDDLQNLLG